MADVQHRVTDLENEIKVLKNEIKAVLLDIREQYLNAQNPFNPVTPAAASNAPTPIISIAMPPAGGEAGAHTNKTNVTTYSTLQETTEPTDIFPSSPEPTAEAEEESSPKATADSEEETPGAIDTISSPSLEPYTEEEESPQRAGKRGRKETARPLPSLEPCAEEKETLQERAKQATRYRSSKENGGGINIITIAGLSKWVDESTEKIGKERAAVMVEACHMIGHLSLGLKDLLIKLVQLAQTDEPKKGKVTTRDYLGVIAQLDSLLGYSSESESALLSILSDSREPNHG